MMMMMMMMMMMGLVLWIVSDGLARTEGSSGRGPGRGALDTANGQPRKGHEKGWFGP